jgi:hypothetical protein
MQKISVFKKRGLFDHSDDQVRLNKKPKNEPAPISLHLDRFHGEYLILRTEES